MNKILQKSFSDVQMTKFKMYSLKQVPSELCILGNFIYLKVIKKQYFFLVVLKFRFLATFPGFPSHSSTIQRHFHTLYTVFVFSFYLIPQQEAICSFLSAFALFPQPPTYPLTPVPILKHRSCLSSLLVPKLVSTVKQFPCTKFLTPSGHLCWSQWSSHSWLWNLVSPLAPEFPSPSF